MIDLKDEEEIEKRRLSEISELKDIGMTEEEAQSRAGKLINTYREKK